MMRRIRRLLGLDRLEHQLDHVVSLLHTLIRKENHAMAIGQEILDAVTALTGSVNTLQADVDSIISTVEALIVAGTISPEVGAHIIGSVASNKAAVDDAKAKLEAEIAKLTPPPPTPLS